MCRNDVLRLGMCLLTFWGYVKVSFLGYVFVRLTFEVMCVSEWYFEVKYFSKWDFEVFLSVKLTFKVMYLCFEVIYFLKLHFKVVYSSNFQIKLDTGKTLSIHKNFKLLLKYIWGVKIHLASNFNWHSVKKRFL